VTFTATTFLLLTLVAQTTPPPNTPDAKTKAQILLKEGARLYEQGSLVEALEKFNQAYAEFASPKLLYNIGQTCRDLGRPAEAMEAFERFLAEAPDASFDMTAEARNSVAELRVKLGRLHIQCTTPKAEISIDGKVVGLSPLPDLLWATPGKHQVTARHPDTTPAVEDVEVQIGSVDTVNLVLHPLAKIVVATPPIVTKLDVRDNASPQPQNTAEADKGFWLGRTWTWVAAGSAVALAGGAMIVGASMKSKFDSLNRSCGSASTGYPGCNESDINSLYTKKNVANILWGLSGAAAVTTGVLFFVEGRSISLSPMAGTSVGILAGTIY
jgi:hypothetical protein